MKLFQRQPFHFSFLSLVERSCRLEMFQLTKIFLVCLAASQVTAMVGGRNSLSGEFPAFVGIVLPLSSQICGASIFNRNHVLTAANCMLSNNNLLLAPNQLSIIHGSLSINFNLPRVSVQAIYVHPQYNPFTFENDIAVVRTASDFIFPQVPIPIVAPADISERIGKKLLWTLRRNRKLLRTFSISKQHSIRKAARS